jgi:hypothetical protein
LEKIFETIIEQQENVLYEGETDFESLCETKFLRDLFASLSSIMGEKINDYIFFILSGGKNTIPQSTHYDTDKKKVLLFISDESGREPYHLAPYYFAVFKIHLQFDKFCVKNIFNFPLGCVNDVPQLPVVPINDRKYNIFFSGNLNRGRSELYLLLFFGNYTKYMLKLLSILTRIYAARKILLMIKSNFDNKFNNSYIRFTAGFKKGISPTQYGKIISNSKIVLCPKGFVFSECFRHYEAMRAGCVIISEKLPKTYFYKDSPIIQISDWREGLKIATELQANTRELERISKLTQDWYEERCSGSGVARYMNDLLIKLDEKS